MSAPRRIVEVRPGPGGIADAGLEDRACAVIDVLRACTTIAVALDAGARGVVPVGTVETAIRLSHTLGRDSTLLGGEVGSLRIEGFDLGNSPGDYRGEVVGGKTIVLCTTNGARALATLAGAKECVAASFVNLGACARRLAAHPRVTLVCAGAGGAFSLEDFVCAGALVDALAADGDRVLDDGARTARDVWARHADALESFLRETDHGRRLVDLGFEADVDLAARRDLLDRVPVFRDGRLVIETPTEVTATTR